MPPLVSLIRQDGYDAGGVRRALVDLLAPLGGMAAFVPPGSRVLLKPNIVMGFPPERAATTHPALLRAVAELALECGAHVSVGDSPGIGSAARAGRAAGLDDVVQSLGLRWVEFTPADVIDPTRTFKRLSLARELLDADVVINLPKLKTHCQMLMSLAVKNMFGAVVGLQKFQWHYRAGQDKQAFARMLYEICMAVRPALHIMDAIVSMDGNGPTHGQPNATGFLAASQDPCALDAVILDILGIDRHTLYTLQAAQEAGEIAWMQVVTTGPTPEDLRPAHWTAPETLSLDMLARSLIQRLPLIGHWLRRQLTPLPVCQPESCVRCGECVRICPAEAMQLTEHGVAVDPRRCIRCYCCHELCPHSAMALQRSLLLRIFT